MIAIFLPLPRRCCWLAVAIAFSLCAKCSSYDNSEAPSSSDLEFFESRIRPILVNHCYECHSVNSKKLQANLLLDSRQRILKGGDSGSAMTPRNAAESSLIAAVRYESYEMPPQGKLPDSDIEALENWVNMGAPWPDEPEPESNTVRPAFDLQARQQSHWMWRPIVNPPVPTVVHEQWPKQALDRFILSKLEFNKLQPAAPIDRRGFLRRLSLDLIGLPPSPAQVQAFEGNASETAIEEVVDSLLRSPQFGERWGRHWLDLVRYAESRGHEFDADTPNAFQYRDYVIRAFNDDVPYDQLVREHIAGDLLEHPRLNATARFNESILGTGFWYMGEWIHSPVDIRKDETDRFDNMIDVMSKTFLGVTVSCARCHDHKFDAISTRDYYSLTGFLQGSEYRQARFQSIEQERQAAQALKPLDESFARKVKDALTQAWERDREKLLKIASEQVAAQGSETEFPWPTLAGVPSLGNENSERRIVVNYSAEQPSEIIQDGFIFGSHVQKQNSLSLVDQAGKTAARLNTYAAARNDSFWHGLKNLREKPINQQSPIDQMPRPSRTLLTPSFDVVHGWVSCLIRGSGHIVACVDSHRLVLGPLHAETIQNVPPKEDQLRWVSLNLNRYLGHRIHIEFTPGENVVLEVVGVVDGKSPVTAVDWVQATSTSNSDSTGELQGIAQTLDHAIQSWRDDASASRLQLSDIAALHWLLEPGRIDEVDQLVSAWTIARTQLRSQVPNESWLAMAMLDATGEDDRVLIRGSSGAPGDVVPRRFLEAIDGDKPLPIARGSGRLELADRINDPSNPLTSRVIVNRVWHHLMGRGIVPTVDDFGVLGQPPTNPELLDHLAVWFNEHGRSIKKLIKYIVLSQTYQMSGNASADASASDPSNLLWQHVPPKRLPGEIIRDSLLAIAGELDSTMGGEPVPIHLTNFMDGRGRPGVNGPLDGNKRRSIYIASRRNFLSPFMMTFDTPNPFSTMGKRNVSNVPAQALILMNDPFVIERAKAFAGRAIREVPGSCEERIEWMYLAAFARPPRTSEVQSAKRFIEQQTANRNASVRDDLSVWSDFAHAMINMKEFVFLR